jgi:hypothetical protein
VGRPRSRRLDEVNTDARRKGIRTWWRKSFRERRMEKDPDGSHDCLSCRAEDYDMPL